MNMCSVEMNMYFSVFCVLGAKAEEEEEGIPQLTVAAQALLAYGGSNSVSPSQGA